MVMTDNVHLVHINPPSLILSLGSVCWATGERMRVMETLPVPTGVATTKSSGGSWPTMFTSFTVTHQDSSHHLDLFPVHGSYRDTCGPVRGVALATSKVVMVVGRHRCL